MKLSPADLHEDRLLSPRELSQLVGLNVKAIRSAFRGGLKHLSVGTGTRAFLKTTPRWWREWLEENEASALAARRVEELLAGPKARSRRPAG